MKNITKKSKRNPWRNTRNDYNIPWNDILASIFMIILPFIIIFLSLNIVFRVQSFYSFYFAKSSIVKEIPYDTNSDKLTEHIEKFLNHKKDTFMLKEDSKYKPQEIFNTRDENVVKSMRKILDITLIIGLVLFILVLGILIYLYGEKEKRLIYESYVNSFIWYVVLIGVVSISIFIPYIRDLIFKTMYGVRFDPADVLIQIFDGGLAIYGMIGVILVSIIITIAIFYLMNKFVSYHKMFKRNI